MAKSASTADAEVPVADGDTVTLSRLDYEALLERIDELEGTVAYYRSRGQPAVPDAVVGRILDGESPVRAWRKHRGLTQTRLAGEVGIGIGYLSEIESGRKPGSLRVLRRIAQALDVDLEFLVD